MVIQFQHLTVEEFDDWVLLPENAGRMFEYIGGETVEVVSNNFSSMIGMFIGAMLTVFVRTHDLGYVTGADGGYRVSGERYIPDAAFISKARQPQPSHDAYNPNPPDLAVEVLSPTNDPGEMRVKIVNYLLAGTVLWVVDPDLKRVEVYVPGQTPKTLGIDDVLDGGNVLPGFSLAVRDIFPEEAQNSQDDSSGGAASS
jgi:Uma2 family endonuclease